MAFFLCSIFLIILASCAVIDARTYRIPDVLTAPLFLGSLGVSFIPEWGISSRDALFGFLFMFPIVFMMWSGSPLPPCTQPSSQPVDADSGKDDPWSAYDFIQFALPSALTWAVLITIGGLLLDPFLWAALPIGILCGAGVLAKGWRGAPWAGSRFSSSWLGGGDMKMLGGCMMMVGISGAQVFAIGLAVLNVLLIVGLKFKRRGKDRGAWESRRIPMGVAIAGSAMIVLIMRNVGLAI